MNTKNLIIAFITVSIAALIVSAFAVFAAARSQYSALLASATEAEDIRTEEIQEMPEASAVPQTSEISETTSDITETEALTEETEIPEESSEENTSVAEESTISPSGYSLKLEGDRLIVTAPDGEPVCERITDASSLHPRDREALDSGITFPDEKSAMNAIYDLIS